MKYIIGGLVIVGGLALAVYLGLVVLFVGGIENIINGAKADPTNAPMIAWGIAEAFVLAEVVGGFFALVGMLVGTVIMGSSFIMDRIPGRSRYSA